MCWNKLHRLKFRGGQTTARQGVLCGPPTLLETSMYLIQYDRGGCTCRTIEPKTIEVIIERDATQFLVCTDAFSIQLEGDDLFLRGYCMILSSCKLYHCMQLLQNLKHWPLANS